MVLREGEAKRPSVLGRLFLSLFFAVFLAAGLGFLAFLAPAVVSNAATHFWHEVACTMVESRIIDASSVEGGSEGWHVRYAYEVEGRDYVGTVVRPNEPRGDARDDLRRSQQLAPGTRTICFVNPENPDESVLERDSLWMLLTPLLPLVFVVIGAGGIWGVWRREPAAKSAPGLTARVEARTRSERAGLATGMFFGAVVLMIGAGLTQMLVIKPVRGVWEARSWHEVPCEIVSSEVVSHDSDDGTTYSVAITYRYTIDGRAYVSNRYRFLGGSSSGRAAKARIVAQHPRGSAAVCFVNPADPTDAVFDRTWNATMWLGLIPVVFVLVGGGLLYGTFRKWRAPPAVAGLEPSTAKALRWLPRAQGSMVAPPVGNIDGGESGPVVLVPRTSLRMKLAGLILIALFWNGIVSIFVFQAISGGWGAFNWFLALFLIPFVAIGLGMIGAVVHGFFGLSNPVPRVTVSRRIWVPGETIEVNWELSGRVQILRRLELYLEGREEATYRRGTDTRTDREVFARFDLADVSDLHAMAAGRAKLPVPSRLMHSFEAKNNKIVWVLRVKGDIRRWPDIDEEFPITIAPATGARTRAPTLP